MLGLEALLRWNHPERGLLCPGEFLSTCEDMGLMKTIGYQVIQHACSALTWLGEQGMHAVDVAVNISFSLDDFGTGFSQLSHLTELPISALKIDACFVRALPGNPHQEAVCAMIIEMARRLGLLVVAEGAETHEQVEFLREQNCQQVQGFYYSPAIPLQQLPRFVQEQRLQRRERLFS